MILILRLEIQISDLDLGMEILRYSGYEYQETKARSYGTKQVPDAAVVVHTFNLGHAFCWRPT